jgi:hypothetical protein
MFEELPMSEAEYLRRAAAARFIGMSTAFLREGRKQGTGLAFSRIGKSPAYSISDLHEWMASRVQRIDKAA